MANYFATPFRAIYQTARLVAVLLLVIYGGTTSAATYAFTPAAKSIYESILRLDLEGSAARIDALRLTDPDNRVAEHLESYLDFFRLYLSEDEQLFNRLAPRHERRLERLAEIDPASPYHRYTQAEARLHWALVRIRFESYYPAFREVNKAHKLLRANQAEHPDFLLNYKDLGLIHAAVGAVPDQFRWGVELFSSLSGSVPEGKRELERALLDRNSPFYRETAVLYAFLQLHLDNQPEAAWQTVSRLDLQPATNKLHCFVRANVALRSNHNDAAIKLLSQQPRDRTTADFPYLDFMQGTARLRRLDSGSQVYFVSFLARWRGKHFAKEARQKLAWAELIDGDEAAYRKQMARVTGSGTTAAGGDESALREAERAELPQPGSTKGPPALRRRLLHPRPGRAGCHRPGRTEKRGAVGILLPHRPGVARIEGIDRRPGFLRAHGKRRHRLRPPLRVQRGPAGRPGRGRARPHRAGPPLLRALPDTGAVRVRHRSALAGQGGAESLIAAARPSAPAGTNSRNPWQNR